MSLLQAQCGKHKTVRMLSWTFLSEAGNSQESGTHMTNERALPQCSLLSQRPVQQLPTRSTCASRDLFRPAWSSQRSGRKPWRLDSPREHPSTNDRWTVSGQSQQVPHLSGGIPLKQTFLHCHSDSPWP